jgi:hypothetical protein
VEDFPKPVAQSGVANTAQKRRRLQNDPYSLLAILHSLCLCRVFILLGAWRASVWED